MGYEWNCQNQSCKTHSKATVVYIINNGKHERFHQESNIVRLGFVFLSLKEHCGYSGKCTRICLCIQNNKCYLVTPQKTYWFLRVGWWK